MTPEIFINIIGVTDMTKAFLDMSENEDELGTVLRVHLLSERLLDAWISAKVGIEDFFINSPGEKFKFNPNFSTKLAMAKKLGFHNGGCLFLSRINRLRNDFAHRYDCGPISDSDINAMKDAVTMVPKTEKILEIEDINFAISPLDRGQVTYSFKSQDTPNRIKLVIIFASFFTRFTMEAKEIFDNLYPSNS